MMGRLNRCFPRLGYASLMSSALVLSAQAQEVLETLVVSGERLAPALSSHVMLNRAADFPPGARLDPAELLQTLPGVQVDSRSNYAQDTRISLRGFGARSAFGVRGIDLQVDGIPMSTPDGQGQLASVMLDNIDSGFFGTSIVVDGVTYATQQGVKFGMTGAELDEALAKAGVTVAADASDTEKYSAL